MVKNSEDNPFRGTRFTFLKMDLLQAKKGTGIKIKCAQEDDKWQKK